MSTKFSTFLKKLIIVFPICPSSLKLVVFYKAPFSDKQFALIGQLTQCIVIGRTTQVHIGNVTHGPYHIRGL